MAASVLIDIPGVGTVEAKNAASEATLQEILKVVRKADKETGGFKKNPGDKGGGGGGDTGGGGGGSKAGSGLESLGKLAYATGFAFAKVEKAVKWTTGAIVGLGEGSTKLIEQFSKVGDDVNSAAAVFSKVPIVGTMFSAVAAAASGVVKSYQDAAASGATFTGSVNQFAAAASGAGMTMADFGALIRNNGAGMLGFGTTVEDGAKRFAQVSKALRTSSGELYALGYSTQDINEGLAKYGSLLRQQGLQGNQTNAQLASGAKNYLKEMDALAKITGEERKAKEAQAEALAKDAQFQAALAGASEEVRNSFRDTVLQFKNPALQNFAKDVMANGVATTEENQKIMAMMPKSAAMLAEFNAKIARGETISVEERNRLNNLMKVEGGAALKNIKTAGAASQELSGTVNALAGTQEINTDAVKKAGEQQAEAAKKTDGMNAQMEATKQRLAEFSNAFQMALANSGLLDLLLKAFEFVANIIMTFVVPIFQMFAQVINSAGSTFIDLLMPAVTALADFFVTNVLPILNRLTGIIIGEVIPAFVEAIQTTLEDLKPAFEWISNVIKDYVIPIFKNVALFIADNLTPILIGVVGAFVTMKAIQLASMIPSMIATAAQAFATAAAFIPLIAGVVAATWPFLAIAAAIAAAIYVFKKLGGDTQVVSDAFSWLGKQFKSMFLMLKEGILVFLNAIPGMRGDYDKDIKDIQEERKKNSEEATQLEKDMAERMRKNREAQEAEAKAEAAKEEADNKKKEARRQNAKDIEENLAKKEETLFKNGLSIKGASLAADKKHADKKEEIADKAEEAEKKLANVDYNTTDSISLLKQVATQQGSDLVPQAAKTVGREPAPASASAGADTTRREIAAVSEEERAKKAKEAAERQARESGGGSTTNPAAPKSPTQAQESAESLLAQLNTKMDQLLRVNRESFNVAERQLSVTRGLSKDMFNI